MKKILIALSGFLATNANAFVLMGPTDPEAGSNEMTLLWGAGPVSGPVASANLEDGRYGTPKDKHRFFRVNTPYLTYGFDRSFVQYFGEEGIDAIDDAMGVINDFFTPNDKSYAGMEELDLVKHGFSGNFATYWENQTAANQNLIDIKTLTLGLVVNRLGLGNPHRYAFTAYGVDTSDTATTGQAIFRTKLNNYDPLTLEQTDRINDIQYSYRLVHDVPTGTAVTAGTVNTMTMDMEEFTSSNLENIYSTVSAIQDAFYGTTQLVWTQPPSKFGFGIYYDGDNAMGGMYKPRHALTFDDAGGLKYLYNKQNVVMEYNPYREFSLADFTSVIRKYGKDLPISQDAYMNLRSGVFPVRNSGSVLVPNPSGQDPLQFFRDPTVALPGTVGTISDFSSGNAFYPNGANTPRKIDWAFRGGIDAINMYKMTYDSLLDTTPEAVSFVWNDVFMTNLAIRATSGGMAPGTIAQITPAPAMYFTQKVGRVVSAPDFLFTAGLLGNSAAGTPTAYQESMTFDFNSTTDPTFHNFAGGALVPGNYAQGASTVIATGNGTANPQIGLPVGAAFAGPGIWAPAEDTSTIIVTFNNDFDFGGFEVIWSGETTVLGNTDATSINQQNWAYIYGPGPNDFKKFPERIDNQSSSYFREWENTIYPSTGTPKITAVSDNGGVSTKVEWLSRTVEELTIIGEHFRNAVALEVINNAGAVVESIYPISNHVVNNNLIRIPAGEFTFESEGAERRIRIWTTDEVSASSEDSFGIQTGPVIITSTSHDGRAYNRGDALTVYGEGFRSLGADSRGGPTGHPETDGNQTVTHVRLVNVDGSSHWPIGGDDNSSFGTDLSTNINVISDNKLIIGGSAIPAVADGVDVHLTMSRGNNPTLSKSPDLGLAYVSGTPEITGIFRGLIANPTVNDINGSRPLHRDMDITLKGVGLNTVTGVELIRDTGISHNPPVTFNLNTLNWTATSNGTDARISANAFVDATADGFGTYRSKLKVTTLMGTFVYGTSFNVNKTPNATLTVGGLTGSSTDPAIPFNGSLGYVWNYMGNDTIVLQNLGGLRAIKTVEIQAVNAPALGTNPEMVINDTPGTTPGVTVTDTAMILDTRLINFTNIENANADAVNRWMKFVLIPEDTDHANIETTVNILMGRNPVIMTATVGHQNGALSHLVRTPYEGAYNNATITGTGLDYLTSINVTDNTGLSLTGVASGDNDSVRVLNGALAEFNASYLPPTIATWTSDSVTMNRRIRVTTPFGSSFSTPTVANPEAEFTLSGAPAVNASPVVAYVGTYGISPATAADNASYDTRDTVGNVRNLVLNGSNFGGVVTIEFQDQNNLTAPGLTLNVDPNNSPVAIFSNDMDQITIPGAHLETNATWSQPVAADTADRFRRVVLTMVHGETINFPQFEANSTYNQ